MLPHLHHVGVVVTDLAAAIGFFVELGLVVEGEATVGGEWVDRVIGLTGVQSDIVMLATPDGHVRIELSCFRSPRRHAPGEATSPDLPGIRHLSFEVHGLDDMLSRLDAYGAELVGEIQDYEDVYRVCYVRGPEGIIVELAERQRRDSIRDEPES